MTWKSGASFTGGWIDGRMSGQGKFTYKTGETLEGQWKDTAPHGKLIFTCPDGTYGSLTRSLTALIVYCAVCSVQCAVCSVQCAVCLCLCVCVCAHWRRRGRLGDGRAARQRRVQVDER